MALGAFVGLAVGATLEGKKVCLSFGTAHNGATEGLSNGILEEGDEVRPSMKNEVAMVAS